MSTSNIIEFPLAAVRARHAAGTGESNAVVDLAAQRAVRVDSAQAARRRPLMLDEVRDALAQGRVQMHYQPQYDLATGEIQGAEALVRLIDTNGQLVYPDRFIELVEHSELIVPLGRTVIDQVCRDLVTCRAAGSVLDRVAINLSAHQLNCDHSLVDFVATTLAAYRLEFADLEFELTERQRLDADGDGSVCLAALAARGSRISIDDFGIGYSSVVCLTQLPISAFKIDRALICRLPEDEAMQSVVRCLLKLADHLELEVVAEGVETPAQHAWLCDAGCPSAQGFVYAKPMMLDSLYALLRKSGPSTSLWGFDEADVSEDGGASASAKSIGEWSP